MRLFTKCGIAVLLVAFTLCFSAIAVANDSTSQVFLNDTDAPVYGLSVTFDQKVEIQQLGEGFSNWTVLEEGTTVLFYDGEIPTWGSFYFFWSPAEARVVEPRWLDQQKAASLGTSDASASKLPSWLHVEEGILFEDDFEGRSEQWALGTNWQIFRESLNSCLRGEEHAWATLNPVEWSDYSVQLRFRLIGGDPFHFNFRCNQGRVFSRYFLGIGLGGLYLNRQIADDFWDLTNRSIHLQRNRWHTLRLVLNGRNIKVYIDDRLYMNFTDEQLPILSGGIAFETLGPNSIVTIDDVFVEGERVVQDVRWEKMGGPPGGLGYDVRISPTDPNIMFVTDNPSGVNKSYDGGNTWVSRNDGILTRAGSSGDGIPIFSLTIDPNNTSIVWAGTQSARGIYKSTDGGETWTKMDNGVTEGDEITFRGFAVRPGNSDVVFAAAEISTGILGNEFDKTKGKIYKTEDGGLNWQPVWEGDNLARIVIFDPTNPDVMFASTGIFDREAYNTRGVGVLKSTDGGVTWKQVNQGIANRFIGFLEMHPTNPQILFAAAGNNAVGGPGAVYRTLNGGESWKKVLWGDTFTVVTFSPSNPTVVYAGSASAFYRSEDSGNTWRRLYKPFEQCYGPPGIRAGVPISAVVDLHDPMTVYVNNYGGGVFRSSDGGATWEDCSTGYTGADLNAISIATTQPDTVFAVARSGPFRSLDGGVSWEGLAYGAAHFAEWYAVAVNNKNTLEVLISDEHEGTILHTNDGGLHWSAIYRHPQVHAEDAQRGRHGFRALAWAPSDPDTVYAGICAQTRVIDGDFPIIDSFGMYKFTRHANSWRIKSINEGLEDTSQNILAVAVHPNDSNTVYASIWGAGIYKTEDGGGHWHQVNNGLMGLDVRSLVIDPDNPSVIYAGLAEGVGIFKTSNEGELWEPANAGMVIECPSYLRRIGQVKPGITLVKPRRLPFRDYYSIPWSNVTSIVIDPTDTSTLYAADAAKGVYMSVDAGTTWYSINAGLAMRAVDALSISADGTILYAATSGGGVFKLSLDKEDNPA